MTRGNFSSKSQIQIVPGPIYGRDLHSCSKEEDIIPYVVIDFDCANDVMSQGMNVLMGNQLEDKDYYTHHIGGLFMISLIPFL